MHASTSPNAGQVRNEIALGDEATTRERVLGLVVENGPITASTIASELGLTAAGVRRHIGALERDEQIIEHEPPGTQVPRRGRPAKYYVATDVGRADLTEDYSDLATQVLDFLVDTAGDEAADAFATQREADIERRYRSAVDAAGDHLPGRVRALADVLTRDGYASTVREIGGGTVALQLCQGHCPIQDVAESYPQLCEAEKRAFSRLLGIHVQRLSTLANGGHVCTTHVPLQVPPKARTVENHDPTSTPTGVKEGSE